MTVVNVTPVVPTPIGVSRAGPAGKGWVFADGKPTDDLGRIGDLYLDTVTFEVYGPKTSVWPDEPFASLKVADSVLWNDIEDKPATFPPSTHAHVIADITGLVTALANKAALVHTQALSTITDAGTAAARDVGTDPGDLPELDGSGKLPVSLLPDAILGALSYQSAWNATTNSPTIPAAAAGNKGWYYVVTTAGSTSVSGITDWKVGDWLISNGTAWDKIDNTDQVVSVAGLNGVITDSALRSALALIVGTNVQAFHALLEALSGLTTANNKGLRFTGSNAVATYDLTAFALTILDDADGPAVRTTISAEPLGELVGINTQTSSYTAALTDKGKMVELNNASANNFTIPPNSTVAFPIPSRIDVVQYGAGQTTLVAGAGVTIRSAGGKLKLTGQYSGASLYKRGTNEWVAVGDLAT